MLEFPELFRDSGYEFFVGCMIHNNKSVSFLSSFLTVYFALQTLLSLMQLHLFIFIFIASASGDFSKKFSSMQISCSFPGVSSSSLIVSGHTYTSLIHLVLSKVGSLLCTSVHKDLIFQYH